MKIYTVRDNLIRTIEGKQAYLEEVRKVREDNIMSFFTREQRYTMLCAIKRGAMPSHSPLTADEEQFIQDYAFEKLTEVLSDPEVKAALERLKDK